MRSENLLFLTLSSLVFLSLSVYGKPSKPNMIVIMCDDLGYADVGFNGCKDIPTPNIDSIAANGVRCSSGHAGWWWQSQPRCGDGFHES
jgi:hypothetical protein